MAEIPGIGLEYECMSTLTEERWSVALGERNYLEIDAVVDRANDFPHMRFHPAARGNCR
jgi:hypothetical protein